MITVSELLEMANSDKLLDKWENGNTHRQQHVVNKTRWAVQFLGGEPITEGQATAALNSEAERRRGGNNG
jgi:hypothetical protein